jgi:hypothetical protein
MEFSHDVGWNLQAFALSIHRSQFHSLLSVLVLTSAFTSKNRQRDADHSTIFTSILAGAPILS